MTISCYEYSVPDSAMDSLLLILGEEKVGSHDFEIVFFSPVSHAMSNLAVAPVFAVIRSLEIGRITLQKNKDVSMSTSLWWWAWRQVLHDLSWFGRVDLRRWFWDRCGQVCQNPVTHLRPLGFLAGFCVRVCQGEGESRVLCLDGWRIDRIEIEDWSLGDSVDRDIIAEKDLFVTRGIVDLDIV